MEAGNGLLITHFLAPSDKGFFMFITFQYLGFLTIIY